MVDRNSRTPSGIEDGTDIVGEHGERVTEELVEIDEERVEGGEEANHYDGSDDAAT